MQASGRAESLFTPAISPHFRSTRGYPSCSVVKNLPAKQEMRVRSLGQEDPLEKEIATHSSILAWKNTMDREAWRATVHGVTKSST